MRVLFEIARRSFARQTAYRAATIGGLLTNTVFGFLRAYVVLAVFAVRDDVAGLDAVGAVTFVFATQGMVNLIGAFGGERELSNRIKSGDVATDLHRPVDLQAWWAADFVGRAVFSVLTRLSLPLLAASLVFELRLPDSAAQWAATACSVLVAAGVAFAFWFVIQMTAFWTLNPRGALQLATLVVVFFSGVILPMNFFPPWLAAIARLTPFPSMLNTPASVFAGINSAPFSETLLVQGAWLVGLIALGRAVQAAAVRRVVIQGG